jgi:hypothetical protein
MSRPVVDSRSARIGRGEFLKAAAAAAVTPFAGRADELQTILDRELRRSQSDFVVYMPKSVDGSTFDNGNEHFLVFEGPDGSMMAVWTQSTAEGFGDHRIVFVTSRDDGRTWSAPRRIAGPARKGEGNQASWGFPLISRSGRIYVVYNQYQGIHDYHPQMTGTMDCVYSDDAGRTWSAPGTIPMQRSMYDHPDPKYGSNWIVWQRPFRDAKGRWFTGFTRWISKAVRTNPRVKGPWTDESVTEFMRYENIDANPKPQDIRISWFASGEKALRVGHQLNPDLSVCQEPSVVTLPDGRLFCTMRTMTGYIWYSVSSDGGETWCAARPLLRKDLGRPILQPIFCCPVYRMADGRYLLVHHPEFNGVAPGNSGGPKSNRRPAYVAVGEFRPKAEQPLWFSESRLLMDNGGNGIGPLNRVDIGGYTSFTTRGGRNVLWHPERKFFLLGKTITKEILAGLTVPQA